MWNLLKQNFVRGGYYLLVIWWFLCRPKTRGVKCLIECNGNFLLVKPSYSHRRFTIPGGGVRRNEESKLAAYRELKEETGIEIHNLVWFGSYDQVVEYKRDTVQCYYGVVESEFVAIDNTEIAEAGWFSRALLPKDVAPSVHKIFLMYDNR